MLAWIETHIVRFVFGTAALLWLVYEASALVFAYTGDVRVTAAIVGVAPEIAGPIAELPVRTDQRVDAGQGLILIEQRPFALAVASATATRDVAARQHELAQQAVAEADAARDQARARLTDAQATLGRGQTLERSGFFPQARVEDAQRDTSVAEAELRRAEAAATVARRLVEVRQAELDAASAALDRAGYDLSRTRISARVAGRIAPFETRPGDMGIVGQPLLTLITDSDWRLVANIAERHLARLRPGQPAWVILGSDPWRVHRGIVRSVAPGVTAAPASAGEAVLPVVPPQTDWIRLPQYFPVEIVLPSLPRGTTLFHGSTARIVVWF